MRHPPLAPGWIDRPHQVCALARLDLESGESIADCTVVWVEHGVRNAAGDNTILALTAIGSTHHRLDFLIGEGRALDTRRWHILVVDALGNGLSASPSNSRSQPGVAFPRIGIRDMVTSQRRLLDELGIGSLHAVIGASMGGMQALQWAVSHPHRMRRVVAMTPMARTHRWAQLMNELSRRALFEDAACTRPRPRDEAMRLWVPLSQMVIPSTPDAVALIGSEPALHLRLDGLTAQAIEHGPDAFDWLCQSRAYDAHDLGGTPGFSGDARAALASIRAPTLVMAPPLDLYNPVAEAFALAGDVPDARLVEIPSLRGHQSASGVDAADVDFLQREIGAFLR